jgi:hypothetical protein
LIGLADDGAGVGEAGEEGAAVDVVEGDGEGPVVFGVVYFEADVAGDAAECQMALGREEVRVDREGV